MDGHDIVERPGLQDQAFNLYKTHCPLGSEPGAIRVLIVHPGADEAELECSLTLKTKDQTYEALSYTWGNKLQKRGVKIRIGRDADDSHRYHYLDVSPNLVAGLKNLRFANGDRTFWVDAIFINQAEEAERNSQVPMMYSIYTGASSVCVWLGPEKEHSSLALGFVKEILDISRFETIVKDVHYTEKWHALKSLMKRDWFTRRWVVQEIALAQRATLHCGNYPPVSWNEFEDAVTMFGMRTVQIAETGRAAAAVQHNPDFVGEIQALGAYQLVKATSNLFRRSDDGRILQILVDLETLVSILTPFEARIPHDTIYAVLALAKDAVSYNDLQKAPFVTLNEKQKKSLRPFVKALTDKLKNPEYHYQVRYDQSFFSCCRHFLDWIFKKSKSLDILCRPWAPKVENTAAKSKHRYREQSYESEEEEEALPETNGEPQASHGTTGSSITEPQYPAPGLTTEEQLPSWIPTLVGKPFGRAMADSEYRRIQADPLVDKGRGNGISYHASGDTQLNKYELGDQPDDRTLTINGFVVDTIETKTSRARGGLIPWEWLHVGGWTVDEESPPENFPPDNFWRTLVGNRSSTGEDAPRLYRRLLKNAVELSVVGGDINPQELLDRRNVPKITAEFLRRLQCVVWGRRYVRTRTRNHGLVPGDAKKQDLICILYGCSVPVILRPIDPRDRKKGFTFIGPCYLHSMMDGTALANERAVNQGVQPNVQDGPAETMEAHHAASETAAWSTQEPTQEPYQGSAQPSTRPARPTPPKEQCMGLTDTTYYERILFTLR
ncbi:hypothetical protein M8818_002395 [Zalaria obscura]|uniref:Uncharacterized protein n=1 Tax=Zalaria obscura TaxID=2024903 RepID=A0ACC3SI76_9PEZI